MVALEFDTISKALDAAAATIGELVFYTSKGLRQNRLSYGDLQKQALDAAHRLAGLNLPRGSRIGMIADTSPQFLVAFYACQYTGLLPCPLPASVLVGGKDAYIDKLAAMMRCASAELLLSSSSLLPCAQQVADETGIGFMSYENLFALRVNESINAVQPFAPHEDAYIQYSSGSTHYPKGVLISQKAICANATAIIRHGLRLQPDDRAFSWLPFYHDMGLVGFSLAPLFGACSVDYMSPSAFARNPTLWLELMQANNSTITYAPSFAYDLVTRRFTAETVLELSKLRIAGIGGDMINVAVLDRFSSCFSPHGFNRNAFTASYGMAEAVLAICIADPAAPLSFKPADKNGRNLVSCGAPLPGIEIAIVNDVFMPVPSGHEGRILVRGDSIMRHYFSDPTATQMALKADGFLDTGDLGSLSDGQLVVSGRAKDMILQRGRNIWPQDVEAIAETSARLRSGTVAAIGIEDGDYEVLTIILEYKAVNAQDQKALSDTIQTAISRSLGIVSKIVFVPSHWLPFTSSGKLARQQARVKYLTEQRQNAAAYSIDKQEA